MCTWWGRSLDICRNGNEDECIRSALGSDGCLCGFRGRLNVWRTSRFVIRSCSRVDYGGGYHVIENAMSYFFGAESRPFPSDFGTETSRLTGDVPVNGKQILILDLQIVLMALLQFIVRYTKMGKLCVRLPWMSKQLNSWVDVDGWFPLHLRSVQRLPGCRCPCWCTTIRFQQQWDWSD